MDCSRHGALTETVYCTQSVGFVDPAHPDIVCKLNRSLYGLKQMPQAWYSRFATLLISQGFIEAKANTFCGLFPCPSAAHHLLSLVGIRDEGPR
jgi:hypothetical protein